MPRECTSLLAFKKITEHAVGQMPVGFECLCWWFIKSNSSRILGSQGAEGHDKAFQSNPCLPAHASCIPYPYFMPSGAIYSFLQGCWVNSEWYEACKWSLWSVCPLLGQHPSGLSAASWIKVFSGCISPVIGTQ